MLVSVPQTGTNPVEPRPPDGLPKYLREGVQKQDAEMLWKLAAYAEEMAEYKQKVAQQKLDEQADLEENDVPDDWDEDEWETALDDARDEAALPPSKGTVTVNEIDGRGYYYLKWREGDTVKSQYIAPVSPVGEDSG
jgi:hypothetical protein